MNFFTLKLHYLNAPSYHWSAYKTLEKSSSMWSSGIYSRLVSVWEPAFTKITYSVLKRSETEVSCSRVLHCLKEHWRKRTKYWYYLYGRMITDGWGWSRSRWSLWNVVMYFEKVIMVITSIPTCSSTII